MEIINNDIENSKKSYIDFLNENKILNLKCFKWLHNNINRKYDEMFDYETRLFKLSEYNINVDGGVVFDNFKILKFLSGKYIDESDEYEIKNDRKFLNENIIIESKLSNGIFQNFNIKFNKYAYIVTKYYENISPYLTLNIGSCVKIGKFLNKIIVLKINDKLSIKKNINTNYEENEVDIQCRFCFENINSCNNDNHFISVCDCKGTLKYIHTKCLEEWLRNRCSLNYIYITPHQFRIQLKNFVCEICRKKLPLIIKDSIREEYVYLLDFLKTKKNYLILKSILINSEHSDLEVNDNSECTEYIYIQLPYTYKNSLTLGRDKSCDIIFNDVSVSRKHCMIYIERNQLKIQDLQSKFGTLINMQEDIIINELNPHAALQKGNTVFSFKFKTPQM